MIDDAAAKCGNYFVRHLYGPKSMLGLLEEDVFPDLQGLRGSD